MLRGVCSKVPRVVAQIRHFSASPRQLFIYKTLDNVRKDGNVKVLPAKSFESRRYLLGKHGMGFSFHEMVFYKGKSQFFNYANHLEAVMVTKGTGWVEIVQKKEDLGKGRKFQLMPGAMYALDKHDKHWVIANEDSDLHCVTVFTPPIQGTEQINEDEVLPYTSEDGVPDYTYWSDMEKNGESILVNLSPKNYRDAHYYDLDKDVRPEAE